MKTETAKTTYSVVVESGSCDPTYTRWEERAHCGHNHKTLETAQKCLANLTRSFCQHGRPARSLYSQCGGYANAQQTSAHWYNACIHNQDGERVDVNA